MSLCQNTQIRVNALNGVPVENVTNLLISAVSYHQKEVLNQRWLRKILGITYHHINNNEVLYRSSSSRLQDIVTQRRFRFAWTFKVTRAQIGQTATNWVLPNGRRRRGRPRNTRRSTFREDLKNMNLSCDSAIWTWCIFLTSLGLCDSSQSRNCYGLDNLLLEFTFWLESVVKICLIWMLYEYGCCIRQR